jgi:hypothetical protein
MKRIRGWAVTIVLLTCAGCGSTDPGRMDYSGSIAMNILVVVVIAVFMGVSWLASKISGDKK